MLTPKEALTYFIKKLRSRRGAEPYHQVPDAPPGGEEISPSTMTDAEKALLHAHLDSCTHYLEFGSGESTVYAAGVPSIQTITSVESSRQFVDENLRTHPAIAGALSSGKLSFHVVSLGETAEWGNPKDTSSRHLWPNYPLSVFLKSSEHDLILVDGRFRVACTLSCILNAPHSATILIHDFWNRPEYHVVLKFLTVEGRADTLGVFRKREGIDRIRVQSMLRTYQYLPRDRTRAYKLMKKLRKNLGKLLPFLR